MKAVIETLKFNGVNGEKFNLYPRTLIECITNKEGDELVTVLEQFVDAQFKDTYAAKEEVDAISDGTTIAGKATADAEGNVFTSVYASKNYVLEQIKSSGHLVKEIVTSIPTAETALPNIIYLYKDPSAVGSDVYKEYQLIGDEVVLTGDTSIDLSNYVQNEALDKIINGETIVAEATKATNDGAGNNIVATYATKTAVASDISNLTTTVNTKADKTSVDALTNGTTSAGSAKKITTDAGATNQPVYFKNGIPVATTYELNATVPANAKFTDTVYEPPTSYPASMITGLADVATSGAYEDLSGTPTSLPASDVSTWAKAATKPSYTKAEVGLGNVDNTADSAKNVKYATSAGNATNFDGETSTQWEAKIDAKVPNTRTVNGKALSSNITLSASDVGADASGSANTALTSAKSYTDSAIDDEVTARNTAIDTAKSSAVSTAASDATTKANNALASAKTYTDTKISNLINGAPTTLDTLKEISDAMAENDEVVEALNTAIGSKANQSELDTHTGNDVIHVTADNKTEWNKNTTDIANILNGTTAVGNALKLNGLTAEEFVSNDNLLDNGYFKAPVNSRGLTSYGGYQWTIDKWFVNYDTTVTVNDGYITIGGDNNLRQTFDEPLPNGTYTATFRAKSSDGCMCYLEAQDTINGASLGSVTVTLTSEWEEYTFTFNGSPNLILTGISGPSRGQGLSYDVEWIKLEKGSIATPFIPPNKEVEKLKCGATVGDAESVNGFKIYKSLSDIGCTTASTLSEVYLAVPYPAKLLIDGTTLTDSSWNLPHTAGVVEITRLTEIRGYLDFCEKRGTSPKTYRMYITDNAPPVPTGTWVNIADGGDADTVDGYHASEFLKQGGRISTMGFDAEHDLWVDIDGSKHSIPFGWTRDSLRADLAKYLPLDGSVPMSGATLGINNGIGELYADANAIAIASNGIVGDASTQRYLRIYSKTGRDSSAEALQLIEGNGVTNTVLHTGNSAKVATSGKYSDLSGLPTIPTNNNQLANGAGYITGINKTMVTNALGYTPPTSDTNTWRPLGTTADTACAGNDSRLSNARPASDVYSWAKASSKPSYSWSEITSKPSSMPASDVYSWAKAASKPSYAYSEITGKPSAGNSYTPVYMSSGTPTACTTGIFDRFIYFSTFTELGTLLESKLSSSTSGKGCNTNQTYFPIFTGSSNENSRVNLGTLTLGASSQNYAYGAILDFCYCPMIFCTAPGNTTLINAYNLSLKNLKLDHRDSSAVTLTSKTLIKLIASNSASDYNMLPNAYILIENCNITHYNQYANTSSGNYIKTIEIDGDSKIINNTIRLKQILNSQGMYCFPIELSSDHNSVIIGNTMYANYFRINIKSVNLTTSKNSYIIITGNCVGSMIHKGRTTVNNSGSYTTYSSDY